MKQVLFFAVLLINNCFAQDVEFQLIKGENSGSVYELKLFNNSRTPIGVKCSVGFKTASERDTLQVAIGAWYNGNGSDYFYGIEESLEESRYSESFPYYQLVIVNPQTYFITNINLTDIHKFKDKNLRFEIAYTTDLNCDEIRKFTDKSQPAVQMMKDEKVFKSKTVPINFF